jgi:3-oxoacyl-[acyl-carrier protein] reductase
MLTGKRVLISGGTGHVGAEICRTCREYGAEVVFTYHRNEDAARRLREEIPESRAISIDLRDVKAIRDAIDNLYNEVGVIDVLVNNAAISQIMPLPLVEEEDVDLIMDINLKGTLFVTKQVLKGMIRNRSGVVVNIGSIAGTRMFDVPITYAMTKAAINGFTYALAVEMKRFGIRVNSVVPGLLDGGVGQGVPEQLRQDFINHCSLGRAGKAREVAEVVCFLASDRASYINGQNIAVDGGI